MLAETPAAAHVLEKKRRRRSCRCCFLLPTVAGVLTKPPPWFRLLYQ